MFEGNRAFHAGAAISLCTALAFSWMLCTSAFAAGEPQWLTDARAREIKSMEITQVNSKDGWFRVQTPGKLVNTVDKVEGSYSVELDIGGDANVYCEVFPQGFDIANGLRMTLQGALKELEASQGKIEARALESTDAGAYGAVPYISLAWLYRVTGPEGPLLGALKQFAMEKDKVGINCLHNDLGFTRTFAAVTRAFADSLETTDPASTPYYFDISTVSMSGARIGIAVSKLERDAEGDTRAQQTTAMLMATADGAVRSQDSTHINWLRPDGSLINAAHIDVSNGELSHDLSLRDVGGTWTVGGAVQGKSVTATLHPGAQPGNWVIQAQQLRTLLAQPDATGREHTIDVWLAENPGKLTAARTKLLAMQGDGHFTAQGDIGGITATMTLENSSGMATAADIRIGPLDLKLERVYVDGAF